jgi:2-haloalkanoic acid dehalogenase type II
VELRDFNALSFDCYGTLIDWEAVLGPWAREQGLDLDDEALLAAYSEHEARAEAESPGELYPDILSRSFLELARQLGIDATAEEARRLAVSVPDWPAFGDAHDALVSLGKRYKLIILSNVDRASFVGTNRLHLGVTFDCILTAQDIGSYKPSPRNFEALLTEAEKLGIADGTLLHVAQSLFHDHVPAKEAGLATVWINRRHNRPGWGATPPPPVDVNPDWEFHSMEAFAAAVDAD